MRYSLILLFSVLLLPVLGQQNLQSYTPSILFDQGDWEIKSFQNLYTQDKSFDNNGRKLDDPFSQFFFASINQCLYGINDRINAGFDVWIKSSDRTGDGLSPQSAITGIGPKIKIAPFKSVPRLSWQSTFLINPMDDPQGTSGNYYFVDWNAHLWINQFYFDLPLSSTTQLFFQQAFWYRLMKNSANNFLETQSSVFFSYFPNSRWTVYVMSEYFPTHHNFAKDEASAFFAYFAQSGLGLKYQLIPNLIELEMLYTNFWLGSEGKGAGQTFNFGIRIISQ